MVDTVAQAGDWSLSIDWAPVTMRDETFHTCILRNAVTGEIREQNVWAGSIVRRNWRSTLQRRLEVAIELRQEDNITPQSIIL